MEVNKRRDSFRHEEKIVNFVVKLVKSVAWRRNPRLQLATHPTHENFAAKRPKKPELVNHFIVYAKHELIPQRDGQVLYEVI
jgi:hypothetical protein